MKRVIPQTHAEAVRLDDYDELAKHKGNESDMFQWLTHQALHGLTDAQVRSVSITGHLNRKIRYNGAWPGHSHLQLSINQ